MENFEEFVARVRSEVDASLSEWLEGRVVQAASRGPDVEAVADAVRQLVMRGGKRLRPVLLAAAFEACGGESDAHGASVVARAGAALDPKR